MDFRFIMRRLFLGVGAALLIGGWGCTRYADSQLTAVASGKTEPIGAWEGERIKPSTWVSDEKFIPGKTLYRFGILGMGLGAVLVILVFPRGAWVPQGP
jgi:hypothetical protein